MVNVFTNAPPDPGTVGDEQQPQVCDRCGVDCEEGDKLSSGRFRCLHCSDYRDSVPADFTEEAS